MYDKSFLELLKKKPSPHFIISTHKCCDGDGLGAGLALCYALTKQGQKADFLALESIQPKYTFMDTKKRLKVYEKDITAFSKESVFIFVDVNDTRLIQSLYSDIKKEKLPCYFIDHHPMIEKNKEDHFFIDSSCSSTAELIYQLLEELKIPLDEEIATQLFSSIVFDTNCFRYVKDSARPFELASLLAPYIKKVSLIYENLFKTMTVDKLRFLSKLEEVEFHFNNRVAFLYLKEADFKKYKTDSTQAYDMIDIVRDIDQVDSTALIIEKEDGSFKLSLRSRTVNLIPLVSQFNGGGHAHSAGASLPSGNLTEVKKQVLSYLTKENE